MIIVTGTPRGGTSLWMQLLRSAGLDVLGAAFPREWRERLAHHNPDGFYESQLREGVYYKTNPNPKTGRYLHPDRTRRLAVKVFAQGLVRSDHAFLDHVIVSIRSWREVAVSLRRMRHDEALAYRWSEAAKPIVLRPPEVEWLADVFTVVRDLATRRYNARLVSHRALLTDPQSVLTDVFAFLNLPEPVDVAALAAGVRPDLHRHRDPALDEVVFDDATIAALDAFVDAVNAGQWADPAVLTGLNEAWTRATDAGWLDLRLPWTDPRVVGRP
jgi:hypothetical protein